MAARNVEHGVGHVAPANNVYRCLCGADYTNAASLAEHLTDRQGQFVGELDIAKHGTHSIPFQCKPHALISLDVAAVQPYQCNCGEKYFTREGFQNHLRDFSAVFAETPVGDYIVEGWKAQQDRPPIPPSTTPPPMVEPVNLGSDGCDEPLVAPAKRDALLNLHRELSARALALMTRKNQDYAKESDPYANFRMFGALGILVRLSDKLARLRSYEEKGKFAVNDEGLIDTTLDLINYAILYYGYKQQETK